jgi:inosine-uridine nucleoside N-ribohydrolase
MFGAVFGLAGLAITTVATIFGYWQAKQFTQNKLRFVDAVHKTSTPVLAGLGATVVAIPIVAFVPLIGVGTAILFGAGVALGVNAGARDIRKRIGA